MDLRVAVICVRKAKAYFPSQAKSTAGYFVNIKPVFVTNLLEEEMTQALDDVVARSCPIIPALTRDEWKKREDPLLEATKAKNWPDLMRHSLSYFVEWNDSGIRLEMSRLDGDGNWEFDPGRRQILPIGSPVIDIIRLILKYAILRREASRGF